MKEDCSTCEYIKECRKVTEKKLLKGYTCPLWKTADEVELETREELIRSFGLWVLRYEVPAVKNKSSRHRRTRRRRK